MHGFGRSALPRGPSRVARGRRSLPTPWRPRPPAVQRPLYPLQSSPQPPSRRLLHAPANPATVHGNEVQAPDPEGWGYAKLQPVLDFHLKPALPSSGDAQQQPDHQPDVPPDSPHLIKVFDVSLAPSMGTVKVIVLNSPRNANALSRQIVNELHSILSAVKAEADQEWDRAVESLRNQPEASAALSEPAQDSQPDSSRADRPPLVGGGTRAVLISSALPSVFCAGADLKERKLMSGAETTEFLGKLRATFDLLENLPMPTIASVASVAKGGGFELALAADFRVLSANAKLGLPEVKLGIIPGAGGIRRLKRYMGEGHAMRSILAASDLSADLAEAKGLADVVVSKHPLRKNLAQSCLLSAFRLAQLICTGAPIATAAATRAFRLGATKDAEHDMYEVVKKTEDRNEALRAFAEKRPAVWQGR